MSEEKKSKKSDIEARLNDLEAKVRRHSKNWVGFSKTHIGRPDVDKKQGEVGSVRITMLLGICVIAFAIVAFGADIENWSQGTGTAKITQTDRTGDMTLVIDEITLDSGSPVIGAVAYFIQAGITEADGTAVVFATTFSATPAVTVTYDNTIVGRNEAAYVSSVSTNGFTPNGYASSTYNWIAVGLK